MLIGIVTHSICAIAFAVLALVLWQGWRGHRKGGMLLVAAIITTLWAIVAAVASFYELHPALVWSTQLFESLRNLAFVMFLLALLKQLQTSVDQEGELQRVVKIASLLAILAGAVVVVTDAAGVIGFRPFVKWEAFRSLSIFSHLAINLLGLALVEQLYRNTRPEQRWGIRYVCFALAFMFGFEFYLYADALLFKRINADIWAARAAVMALLTPLVAVSAARNPQWSLDVFVSRKLVFHTASLLSAGIYLLFMALAGFYIREFGGDWGGVAQITFIAAALMALSLLLLSGQARAHLRVFLNKHFFNYKYDYREEWVRFTQTLTNADEKFPLQRRIIEALANMVESPGGRLWLKSENGDFMLKAAWNESENELCKVGAEEVFVRFLADEGWVVTLAELSQGTPKRPAMPLPESIRDLPRAWLVIPLTQDHSLRGFIILSEPRANVSINWEDTDLLKTAATGAASYLAQYEADQKLSVARQFEAYNRLSTFVIHDLKNLTGQLSLLVANSKKFRENPEFIDDTFETVENAVAKMNHLLEQLRSGVRKKTAGRVKVLDVILAVLNAKSKGSPVPRMEVDLDNTLFVMADANELETILGHLVQNAQDATPDAGDVVLSAKESNGWLRIDVKDTGSGMDEAFIRDHLFEPFHTTKGDSGMGVGVYQARDYIQRLGGYLEVSSTIGQGSCFSAYLPLAKFEE